MLEVTQVACVLLHIMIGDKFGQLYTCGCGFNGELRFYNFKNKHEFTSVKDIKVNKLQNTNVEFRKRIKATASLID